MAPVRIFLCKYRVGASETVVTFVGEDGGGSVVRDQRFAERVGNAAGMIKSAYASKQHQLPAAMSKVTVIASLCPRVPQ